MAQTRVLAASLQALDARTEQTQLALGAIGQDLTRQTDGSLVALGEAIARQESAFGATINDLIRGFGRLDETMVAFGARLDTNIISLGERFAAHEGEALLRRDAFSESLSRVDAATSALARTVDAAMGAGVTDLIGGFGRLDETMVAFGARMDTTLTALSNRIAALEHTLAQRLESFDRNMVAGFDLDRRTIWEAKAALTVEIKELFDQVASAGGGGLGSSEDGVSLADIVRPHARRGDVENIDIATAVRDAAPEFAELVGASTRAVVQKLEGADLSGLNKGNPINDSFDWANYLSLSAIRVARVLTAVKRHAAPKARVLDYGAYFGNFAHALAGAGYKTQAFDSYALYEGALGQHVELLKSSGVEVLDASEIGFELEGLPANSFDAVCIMSVIEHIPHTPRLVLEAIDRVLKPGGILVLDTPNLGYVYNRRRFLSGHSVFAPIAGQFAVDPPFVGHHREFLPEEVTWMLEQIGHEVLETDTLNYSIFGMSELRGEHLALWRLMEQHPQLRELIFTVSRKPS